jgi:hypothetical protein
VKRSKKKYLQKIKDVFDNLACYAQFIKISFQIRWKDFQKSVCENKRTNAAEWNESSPGISTAETSLTIDNIIYATDPRFAKQFVRL